MCCVLIVGERLQHERLERERLTGSDTTGERNDRSDTTGATIDSGGQVTYTRAT